MLRAALEQVERGARVEEHRARRIAQGARRGRLAREVEHGVAALHELLRGGIGGVDANRIELGGGRPRAPAGPGQRNDLVTVVRQQRARPPAEETGGACHEQLHRR